MTKPTLHFQRFEFKYYLPKNKADKIIPALLNYMKWDPFVKETGKDYYEVHSLYLDSPDFGCFWDKESGIANRKKLRFRFYSQELNPETEIFVEMKRKYNVLSVKDRIRLSAKDCFNSAFDDKLKSLIKEKPADDFLREIFWFKKRNLMKPKLFVTYKRKALVGKVDKRFRVTFDHDIKAQLMNDLRNKQTRLKEVLSGSIILELKYNNTLPYWFHDVIQKYQLQRLTHSKYSNALRMVMPRFDDNNYSMK